MLRDRAWRFVPHDLWPIVSISNAPLHAGTYAVREI